MEQAVNLFFTSLRRTLVLQDSGSTHHKLHKTYF